MLIFLGILTPFILIALVLVVVVWKKRTGTAVNDTATTATATLRRKRNWGWIWVVVIVLVAIGVNRGYRYYKNATQPAAQRRPAATASAPAKPERIIETTAPVGRWSENVSVPMFHWFRIVPEGKIRIRLWNGQEMDSEPGNDTWFGDNILDANFRFMSRETGDVKVKVVMRPK